MLLHSIVYMDEEDHRHKKETHLIKANYVFIRQLHLFRCCLTSGLPLCLANVYDHEDL